MSNRSLPLADLVPVLSGEPRIRALAKALDQPTAYVHVAQVPNAARRALAVALHALASGPVVVVAATPDAALRFTQDLLCWLPEEEVLLFPPSDALPYEHVSPDASALAARVATLLRLRDQQARPLVVTSVKAIAQPTLTPEELAFAARDISQGERVDPRVLIAHLVAIGYQPNAAAEQPGEFSLRGGILDVFPPNAEKPFRLEFWDDEVESIRAYDPLTQRSVGRLRSALIGPAHEIPLWRRTEALTRLDALHIAAVRPEVQEEWQAARAHIEQGERFEGRFFFAPFFRTPEHAHEASFFAHLPPTTRVLLAEERAIRDAATEIQHQANQSREVQIDAAELPAAFPQPLIAWSRLREILRSFALADLSNQPLDPELPSSEATPFELELFAPPPAYGGQLERLLEDLRERLVGGARIALLSPQSARLSELATAQHLAIAGDEEGPDEPDEPLRSGTVAIRHGTHTAGWAAPSLRLLLLTDTEIFGWRQRRAISTRARKERTEAERATFLQSLKPGDYVVHIEHGIARYDGLTRLTTNQTEREFMLLSYASGDRIYVPIDQVDRVSRYVGAGEAKPALTRLGTSDWERTKRKVRQSIEELAADLLDLYAARQTVEGHAFSPDTSWQRELEESFPFTETDDQLRALEEVKADMESERPMDRLICGDVGYGKTEVALRAAFKAVQDGFQVAVLVPTTILAQQHYETFSRRMQAFPLKVEMLSRFRTAARQKTIIEALAKGDVDLIIGTHRLLSQDVRFKRLGLVIIDEEQRFGVRHKERLKQLRQEVDVLTLTATPIPRTMHMALAGIRDLSVIDTPPDDRVPIKTYVQPLNDALIRDAILRELSRGGQVFFVHNRVQSIYSVANRLQKLVPEATIGVGHGQMPEKELEKVMLQFFEGEFDVLVCTTIIETGLDVPSANTMIIDDATNYGLAQLYQLRGRVGRSTQRGYAYLFYNTNKPLSEEATQRLEAIQEATQLGAGFRIAMRDLEIRGAGNLLGSEQSGNIAAIGFDLYSRLLAQAVERLRDERSQAKSLRLREQRDQRQSAVESLRRAAVLGARQGVTIDDDGPVLTEPIVSIDLPINAFLPDDYVPDDTLRLRVYQHIAEARTIRDLRMLRQELTDRFGPLPKPAERLLRLLHIKVLALTAGVGSIIADDSEIVVRLPNGPAYDRDRLRRNAPQGVTIGTQFARLDRRAIGDAWEEPLQTFLEQLAKV